MLPRPPVSVVVRIVKTTGSDQDAAKFPVLASNRTRGWGGAKLDLVTIRVPRDGLEVTLREEEHHFVGLITRGEIDLVKHCDGREERGCSTVGGFSITPAGVTSSTSASGDHEVAALWIPVTLTADCASHMKFGLDGPGLTNVFDSRDAIVQRLADVLIQETRNPPHPAQRLIHEATSYALAAQLLRAFSIYKPLAEKPNGRFSSRTLTTVLNYIEDNLSAQIGLDELAVLANVSKFHFTRLFKSCTGYSPMAYIERSRIFRAQALIRAKSMPLKEIAAGVGFADQSHFTHRFRHVTGITPAAYRRNVSRPYISSP